MVRHNSPDSEFGLESTLKGFALDIWKIFEHLVLKKVTF